MSSGLVDAKGKPLSSIAFKKADPPKTGNAFAPWAGRDQETLGSLPGGSLVQFDLSKLQTEDFRAMRDHYQVNASLAVLSFLQHQADWRVECADKKIAAAAELQLREMWTQLNRSLGTANWCGYSPNALDWENLTNPTNRIAITKVKDLIPEECEVNWKLEEGWAPPGRHVKPKYKVYDGIKYAPQPGWPIPIENSFWYPLLMENGNYQGRKLLRPAFQSWFFSILIHLFANRYFERFGEPVPVGRAPFDDTIDVAGPQGTPIAMKGDAYLLKVLQDLRNRSVVVLPNDRTQTGNAGQMSFDYEIEYLESQMRGADFERYLTRLDEEISIGLFTPILLLRTADVGSYNLGQGHLQVYQWMMNAMNDDRGLYINKYILSKYVDYNYGPNAPRANIVFRKMGNTDNDMIKQVIAALIKNGTAAPDLDELGTLAGLTLKQVRQTTAPIKEPGDDDPADPADDPGTDPSGSSGSSTPEAAATVREITARVAQQVNTAFKRHKFNAELQINMGFKNRMVKALETDGVTNAYRVTEDFYGRMDHWLADIVTLGEDEFTNAEFFMEMFKRVCAHEMEKLHASAHR